MASLVETLSIFLAIILTVYGQEKGSELDITVIYKPEDCKRAAKAGDYVTVTYVAFLPSETGNEQFDNSDNKGQVHFKLFDPASTAMKGWHQGIDGMCINERREIIIPHGPLTINHKLPNTKTPPEGRDVGYNIQVRSIQDEPPHGNLFKQMDFDMDQQITKDEVHRYIEETGLGGIEKFENREAAIDKIFGEMDKDSSGAISHAEFPGPKHDEF